MNTSIDAVSERVWKSSISSFDSSLNSVAINTYVNVIGGLATENLRMSLELSWPTLSLD